MTADGNLHAGRIIVGFTWLFAALVIADHLDEAGYSLPLSFGIGLLLVPVFVAGVYIIGTVGLGALLAVAGGDADAE